MPKIKYVQHDGKVHEVDVPTGWSVMEGAVKNMVPGIDADCGGACACATCHVYVDPAWADKVGTKSDMEETMLDFAQDLEPTSRLSCQIKVSAELDGLVVKMPKTSTEVIWQRHHTIMAVVAIVIAIAFLMLFAPSLGWIGR